MLVYLRITVTSNDAKLSERTELSVNRVYDPLRWNKKAGRATGTKEDARSLNAYLDALQVKVYEAHRDLLEAKEIITAEAIKNKLKGIEVNKSKMLLEVFREHNKQMSRLIINAECAQGTLTHFETAYKHLQTFILWKHDQFKNVPIEKVDISVDKLDYSFISDFEYYLKTEVCAHNTAMKYLGDFKKIVLICVKRGWLSKDPFIGFKMSRKEVQKDFLVDYELKAIEGKQFLTERLMLVRDIFLFSCYTGLAYADVRKLKASEVRVGIDGKKWLFIQRKKSTTPAPVPLLAVALTILEKYKEHPRCVNLDRLLPILSNQKMNEYLKEIAERCEIAKNLTFHTARHTFGTTVTLNNDVPIESVSKMLGHRSLKQTQHYAKILNKKVAEDMEVLNQKLFSHKARNL